MIGRPAQLSGTLGRWFFALGVAFSGVQQMTGGIFIRLIHRPGAWLPHPALAARALGAVLIAVGAGLLLPRWRRSAAWTTVALLALIFVVFRVPEILAQPATGYVWTNPAKVLALLGGAWMLTLPERPAAWKERIGPLFLATFLVLGGIQHFVYADFVDTLVPAWLGHLRFWTCLAGACLIAGGIGTVIPRLSFWAAAMSALMIFLWVPLLHVPRAVSMPDPGETSAIFEALAISGVAALVAGRVGGRKKPKVES
ncbi:MAG TPA: hypothetical protein VGM73_17400 [Candidatus Didemnitutus sp.]|jgi:uncharacterized membrane protein